MADGTEDPNRNAQHQQDSTNSTPPLGPLEAIWRIARTAIEIGGLYATYKHNEGAALAVQALVMLGQSIIDTCGQGR